MVETEIEQNTKTNYDRNRNIIEYKKQIMVETEISYNTKTNYGRNRNKFVFCILLYFCFYHNLFLYSILFLFLP